MRVLVSAVSRLTSPSGICRFAANLALALDGHHEVFLAVGEWQERYYLEDFGLKDSGVTVKPISIQNKAIARNAWYLKGLPLLATQVGADVVHASYPIPVDNKKFKAKVVGTVHDLYPFEIPENFGFPQYLLNQMAFRKFIKNCDAVTCVSGETLKALDRFFPEVVKKLGPMVVYNTVTAESPPFTQPPALKDVDPFILAVAQHRKNKNLDEIIRSYTRLKAGLLMKTKCVIVGSEGPETEALKALVKEIDADVIFLKDLNESELAWTYANALVLVSASSHEGFCLPPVEASLYGCPAVCSNIPILHEIAPPGAEFFELSGMPESLDKAIQSALGKPRPEPLGPGKFSREAARAGYEGIYKK